MKIGVFGASGMLGHILVKLSIMSGLNVTPLSRKKMPGDLCEIPVEYFEASNYDLKSHDFDYVINCCGLIKQRSTSNSALYEINREFPKRLASKYGKRLIHISTDCVFSGKRGMYVESDEKDAQDNYGLSKSGGEEIDARVLRTSIIGTHAEDCNGLLEWARSQRNRSVEGYIDHFWSGVTTLELSKLIIDEIENIESQRLRHVYSNRVSKFDVLNVINDEFDLGMSIKVASIGLIDRSLSTIFEDNKIRKNLRNQVQELRDFERIKL